MSKARRSCASFLIAGSVLMGAPLIAQIRSHIAGVVRDPSGAVVPNALVSVVSEDNGFRRATQSRADGSYFAVSLEPGAYKITVRKEGFRTLVRLGVRLTAGQPARVDFMLSLGSMQEVITVHDTPQMLTREDASVGTFIGGDRIERLPVNGRDLLGLLALVPGTIITPATRGEAGQFTATGQRPNTNYFIIDGVSGNSGVASGGLPAQSTGGSLPGMTALGSLHGLASLDSIDEFRVQTSTEIAEFGRLPGAQVAVITRTGSNEFHGSMFHMFRHERLDANDWFANRHGDARAPMRMNDFGSSLAGPVKRNRTFFFLGYEGMRLRQPFAWRATVPTKEARPSMPGWVHSVLDLFPAPNGPSLGPGLAEWTGRNMRPSRLDTGSARLDHIFTPRLSLFARYSHTPSSNEFSSTQIGTLALRSRSLTAGLNARISPRIMLDFRANYSDASGRSWWRPANSDGGSGCDLEPVTAAYFRVEDLCDYLFRFSIGGVGQLAYGRESNLRQSQAQVVSSAALTLGSHSIRLGGDYRLLKPQRDDQMSSFSMIAETFSDLAAGRSLWFATAPPGTARGVLREISAFSQDTWRITDRLTATFGLRWEVSPVLKLSTNENLSERPIAYLFPDRATLRHSHAFELAPRAGLAYRLTSKGTTVLRAGWGLYYDSSLSIATDLVNGGPFTISQYGSASQSLIAKLLTFGFAPDLRLPVVKQWNGSIEHEFRGGHFFSATYAGSAGRRLHRREMGGPESTSTLWLALATNRGISDYHGLQVQYRKSLARRFQASVAHTWSHSIDNSSSDSALHWIGAGVGTASDRARSDFDVRHSFFATVSCDLPGWARGWTVDSIFHARSGFPINLLNNEHSMGLTFANVFRPNVVADQPLWLDELSMPGGRRLNRSAFQQSGLQQGTLGRNAIAGFGTAQMDMAVRRDFSFGDRRSLQLRLEAFNVSNHPSFADPVRFLSSPLFGESPSMLNLMLGTGSPGSGMTPVFQSGGARSLQLSLRLRF